MPAGGIMFEKVLKRLCPCYYNRRGKDSTACLTVPTKTNSKHRSSFRGTTSGSSETGGTTTTTATATATATSTTQNSNQGSWKGTLNLVQPQPIYVFPLDSKKSMKKQQKNLLKPPLYWKKVTQSLHPEGPPVFQESRSEFVPHPNKKLKKKKKEKSIQLKHSETVANISTATSAKTVEVRWLKSQSLDNIYFETSSKKLAGRKKKKQHGVGSDDWMRNQVLHDVSHGIILFTAAYFSEKKTCMINIERLENLAKKGKEGNSYYSVVKLTILPSEKFVKCTKILPNCSNPDVKQDFSFSVRGLTGKVLRFSVYDASLQKQHEAVGHALLTLEDIICNQPKRFRVKLYRRSQPHMSPGNLYLSLKYSEDQDKFTILVEKAKSLSLQKDKNVKLNTYVKVTLYSYGEKVKTKKSILVMDSREPKYNSTFTFQVRKDQIDYLSVTIAVRLKGFVNDLTIGRLNFGPFFYVDYKSQTLTPWGRVFLNKEFVCHWFRMYL